MGCSGEKCNGDKTVTPIQCNVPTIKYPFPGQKSNDIPVLSGDCQGTTKANYKQTCSITNAGADYICKGPGKCKLNGNFEVASGPMQSACTHVKARPSAKGCKGEKCAKRCNG